jgi:ribosomal protein S18 acetylase RimI-like enzyme
MIYLYGMRYLETYQTPEWAPQAWVDATLHVGIRMAPWQIFVGYLESEPVATHILFNGASVAGVYAVATIPAAQRQGIGAAITLKPLLDAREMGYRYAVLFSTEAGLRVYQRIGFRLVNV